MLGEEWGVRIKGLVSRLDSNSKSHVAVPHGDYRMRELSTEEYELSREGGPTFRLSLREVAQYLGSEALEITKGTFP
jgi:hypothetical protein